MSIQESAQGPLMQVVTAGRTSWMHLFFRSMQERSDLPCNVPAKRQAVQPLYSRHKYLEMLSIVRCIFEGGLY